MKVSAVRSDNHLGISSFVFSNTGKGDSLNVPVPPSYVLCQVCTCPAPPSCRSSACLQLQAAVLCRAGCPSSCWAGTRTVRPSGSTRGATRRSGPTTRSNCTDYLTMFSQEHIKTNLNRETLHQILLNLFMVGFFLPPKIRDERDVN